jgi:hypothetical protein
MILLPLQMVLTSVAVGFSTITSTGGGNGAHMKHTSAKYLTDATGGSGGGGVGGIASVGMLLAAGTANPRICRWCF